jgi:hypothetical protein
VKWSAPFQGPAVTACSEGEFQRFLQDGAVETELHLSFFIDLVFEGTASQEPFLFQNLLRIQFALQHSLDRCFPDVAEFKVEEHVPFGQVIGVHFDLMDSLGKVQFETCGPGNVPGIGGRR